MQHDAGILVGPVARDTHNAQDIFRFMLTFARRRRAARKKLSTYCSQYLDTWRRSLLTWFTKMADRFVLAECLDNADSQSASPPAVAHQKTNKRKYTIVSVEAKWEALEAARRVRVSPNAVLALNSESSHLGCHEQAADPWLRKDQNIYWRRCDFALASNGVDHSSLVHK